MAFPGPIIRNPRTAGLVALALLALGFILLYDAYEGRGRKSPWFIRWATAW